MERGSDPRCVTRLTHMSSEYVDSPEHGEQPVSASLGVGEQRVQRREHIGQHMGGEVPEGVYDGRSAAERYVDGAAGLHVHLGLVGAGGPNADVKQTCALFIALDPLREYLPAAHLNLGCFADGEQWQEVPVLVDVPESVEQPEQRVVASLVRLTSLDLCERIGAHADERPVPIGLGPLVPASGGGEPLLGHAIAEREPDLIIGCGVVQQNELEGEVIERGAEVVDDLAHDRAQARDFSWLPAGVQPEEVLGALRVSEGNDGPAVRIVAERKNFMVKRLQLLYRTIDLGLYAACVSGHRG